MKFNKRFYRRKNCGKEFSEISDDKKCENCGSDKFELIRLIQSDNAGEIEIRKDIG